MTKKLLTIPLLLALAAGASWAAEAKKSRRSFLMTYFLHLKQGLTESAVQSQYQKGRGTSVAAVRGEDQKDARSDPNKPVMKQPAKDKKLKAEKAERAEFEKAVDLVTGGKIAEGVAAMDAFEARRPKSSMLKDVREAKAKAKELMVEQKKEGEDQ